jgi:rod shape-determining protein MreC
METSRDDFGIAIRSAFLQKGTQQRFSLFALTILSITLIAVETLDFKPLRKVRSLVQDLVYHSALVVNYPLENFSGLNSSIKTHFNIYKENKQLLEENIQLKNNIDKNDFLKLENTQLRKLIEEQVESSSNLVSARVILDKQSPYLNSFVINVGSNKGIKNSMAVLDGKNFIGRIVDVNFFSSRVLLVSDLNSKIPVIIDPSASHAILKGRGSDQPSLEYFPENNKINTGDKIFTSGKAGVFIPGIPIGTAIVEKNKIKVLLFSDLNQISFANVSLAEIE